MNPARVKKKIVLFSSDLKYEGLPLSLLHVTALLDKTRYGIKIITAVEYPGTYKNEILKQCKEAVCFGVSCYMGEPIINAVEVSRAVKQVYPSLPVIWGGELTATLPDKILESDYVDYLCRGQGERTFYEFVDMIETDDFKNISRIRGLSYKENGVNVHNPKREPEDLDSFPDFDLDLINRFHAQFGVFQHFHFGDTFLAQNGGRTADRPQVEPAVGLTGIGHPFGPVAFGQHHQTAPFLLEGWHIRIHPPGGGGAKGAGSITFGGLGRTSVVDDVVLEVFGQTLALVQPFLEFCMGDVPCYNDSPREHQPGFGIKKQPR